MKETIVKINKTKSWFIKKVNKMDNPLARLIKKKRKINATKLETKKERLQQTMQKYKGLQETFMNNYMAIKWITWKKWTDSLEKLNLPRLKQEQIEIMNNSITALKLKL